MAEINDIRRSFYEQGKSIAEIARETGFDRKTISKYIEKESFNEPAPLDSKKSKVGRPNRINDFTDIIDTWLMEDLQYKRKQRHTAKRIYDRLCQEHGETFDCCYKTVSNYVSRRRKVLFQNNTCYVKLQHIPGEAQVDFGSADFHESGKLFHGKYLNLSFPHSNQGYMQLFKGENQECLFEGLINIFNEIGGVPTKLWFDNMSTVVTKILKDGGRNLTEDFMRFKNHYRFDAVFCSKGKGNEKGHVENKVGYHRRNFLVPVPVFDSLDQYNQSLFERCHEDGNRPHYNKDDDIRKLHLEDLEKLIPLPQDVFDAGHTERVKVNTYGRFTLNNGLHEYSAVPKLAGEYTVVHLTASSVQVLDRDFKEVVIHSRLYGDYRQSSIKWLPFLSQLAAKPNAIKYSGIMEVLPDPLKTYLEKCDRSEKSRLFATLSDIGQKAGFEQALEVAAEASRLAVFDPDSLLTIHAYRSMDPIAFGEITISKEMPEMAPVITDINAFDAFLYKGGDPPC